MTSTGTPDASSTDEPTSAIPHLNPVGIFSVGELFGGVERHILGLHQALGVRGVAAPLFLFHDGELARQARQQGAEVVLLPPTNRSLPGTSRQLAQHLRDRGIGTLHVHGYKATVCAAMSRRWIDLAVVKTEHGMPEVAAGNGPQLKARLYHALETLATQTSVDAVCYVTADLRAQLPRLPQRVYQRVIANGVAPLDRAKLPIPMEFAKEGFHVPVVGRIELVKGHIHAIEAIATPGMPPDVHLHFIGTGPRETDLRQFARSRGMEARVHFLGFRRNIFDYLTHCSALLIPSLHEGLPYTLLEAMALATPIIASDVGGLAEVLEHDGTALLVPVANPPAIAAAIQRLHADHGLRHRLAAAALETQQSRYSLHAMANAYFDVYRSVQPPRPIHP